MIVKILELVCFLKIGTLFQNTIPIEPCSFVDPEVQEVNLSLCGYVCVEIVL